MRGHALRAAGALALCIAAQPALGAVGSDDTRPWPPPAEVLAGQQTNCPWDAPLTLMRWEDAFRNSSETHLMLPDNANVVVGATSLPADAAYTKIVVPPTSQLIFRDAPITLRVNALVVYGTLRIGSPSCRVRGPIRILFHGQRADATDLLDGHGSKGMAIVGGGRADVFGARFYPTWTRVARTAAAGAEWVELAERVNWRPGQEVAVVTTASDDTGLTVPHENEVRTIAEVSSGGTRVRLAAPLVHLHYAGAEYAGEVALLSRSVTLEGEPDADGYGGQCTVTGEGTRGRFAGVAARHMGQTNLQGRYPFGLSMIGSGSGSYVTDSAVVHSYYRCYAVQGSSDVVVSENVAFNATGSCYAVEDGVEENNTFSYNLAAHVHAVGAVAGGGEAGATVLEDIGAGGLTTGERAHPADASPVGFYIANARNTFVGNTVSGGWSGFNFASHPRPVGRSRGAAVEPRSRPPLSFRGNTAHSTGWHWRYGGGVVTHGTLDYVTDAFGDRLRWQSGRAPRHTVHDNGTAAPLHIAHTHVWASRWGVVHWGDACVVDTLALYDVLQPMALHGDVRIGSGFTSGRSDNTAAAEYPSPAQAAYWEDAFALPTVGEAADLTPPQADVGGGSTDLHALHGWLMVVAWCFLAPAGVIVKRYGKTVFGLGAATASANGVSIGGTFIGHVGFMALALAAAITAFVIAASGMPRKADVGADALQHSRLGYVAFTAMALVALVGIVTPIMCPTADSPLKAAARVGHVWGGRTLLVLVYYQVFSGLQRVREFGSGGAALSHVAAAGLAVSLVVALMLELLQRLCDIERKDAVKDTREGISRKIRMDDVKRLHGRNSDEPWVVICGHVYAIRTWMDTHPGGKEVLLRVAGEDATEEWRMFRHSAAAQRIMEAFHVGEAEDPSMASAIDMAQVIATSLVALDLGLAKVLIQRHARNESIPAHLLAVFSKLVKNLESYIPFLPESLLAVNPVQGSTDSSKTFAQAQLAIALELDPPTHVAVAFTDMEECAQLWQAAPLGMKVGLEVHNTAIRDLMISLSGYEVKTIGNAFMVTFQAPHNAFEFALRVQEVLVDAPWPEELLEAHELCEPEKGGGTVSGLLWAGPRIRVGVHWGRVEQRRNAITGRCEFYGNTVNKAARVEALGVGGCSAVTHELLDQLTDQQRRACGHVTYIPLGDVLTKRFEADKLSTVSLVLPDTLKGRKAAVQQELNTRKAMAESELSRGSHSSYKTQDWSWAPSAPPQETYHACLCTVITARMDCSFLVEAPNIGKAIDSFFVPLLHVCGRTEGVLQGVIGGTCTMTWNLAKPCQHRIQALKFIAEVHEMGDSFVDNPSAWGGLLTCGVATGWCVIGRSGTEKQRSMMVLGSPLHLSSRLVDIAHRSHLFALASSTPSTIGVQGEPTATHAMRLIDITSISQSETSSLQNSHEYVVVYEINAQVLSRNRETWGFDHNASPVDATWGSAFNAVAERAFVALAAQRETSETASELAPVTDAESVEEVLKVLADAMHARLCSQCKTDHTTWHCEDCEIDVCRACGLRLCDGHTLHTHTSGLDGIVYLRQRLEAVQAHAQQAMMENSISLELDMQSPPHPLWLGARQDHSMRSHSALRAPPSASTNTSGEPAAAEYYTYRRAAVGLQVKRPSLDLQPCAADEKHGEDNQNPLTPSIDPESGHGEVPEQRYFSPPCLAGGLRRTMSSNAQPGRSTPSHRPAPMPLASLVRTQSSDAVRSDRCISSSFLSLQI